MAKDTENDAHEIPLMDGRRSLEQSDGLINPPSLVVLPGLSPERALPWRIDPASGRRSASKR